MSFNIMEFIGWNHPATQQASELISHWPPNLEGLVIEHVPYGSIFMDALTQGSRLLSNSSM
jgi:hypothetical protein